MKGAEGRRRLRISLWLQRPPDKQTENDVLSFYGELEQNRPELLQGNGDARYQQLMADLRGYIKEPPKPPTK